MRLKRSILLFAITVLIAFVLAAPVLAVAPANDMPANAIAVTSLPYENIQSTVDATGTTGEPESYSCSNNLGNVVWYKLTAPQTGNVYAHTFGSDFDTVIYVVENGYCNLAYNLFMGEASGLAFAVTQGETYTIGFGGYNSAAGNLSVNLLFFANAASNDHPVGRIIVDAFPYTNVQPTWNTVVNLNQSVFEPCGSITNGTPVWYLVVAPVDGTLLLSTLGSDFDTVLVDVDSASCDDDGADGDFYESELAIEATAGGEYLIGVAGNFGQQGNLKFRADFIAPNRAYPSDGQTIIPAGSDPWERFAFNAVGGVEWYKVWIGSADYQTTHLSQWYKGIDICDGSVCQIPQDLWLSNGDYAWWMTYWGPSTTNYGGYWNKTTFSINAGLIDPITNRTPSGDFLLLASPSELSWDHDPDALWYHVWLGTADQETTHNIAWYKASDICAGGTCAVPVSDPLPFGAHQWWMEAWGPGDFDKWNANGAVTFEITQIIIG